MALDDGAALSPAETDAFLGEQDTGVLALARDDEPYAIPVSYGYDAAERQFFLRLVSTPGSDKRAFLADDPPARLVVYEAAEGVSRSVVARGTLETVPRSALTVDRIRQFGEATRPLFEAWEGTPAELEVQLCRLDPAELSGRRVETDRESGLHT